MGATDFQVEWQGPTAKQAFDAAVEQAAWEYGHGGYTGTIAEKGSFVMVAVPDGADPRQFASCAVGFYDGEPAERFNAETRQWEPAPDSWLPFLRKAGPVAGDKWGPACCIALGADRWLFFGMASD